MTAPTFHQYEFVERPANRAGIFSIVAYVKAEAPQKKGQKAPSPNTRVAAGINLREQGDKVVLEAISTQPEHRMQGLARELHRRAVELAHKRGKTLIGTDRRDHNLDAVWDKLKTQREAMEAVGYDGNLESVAEQAPASAAEAVNEPAAESASTPAASQTSSEPSAESSGAPA